MSDLSGLIRPPCRCALCSLLLLLLAPAVSRAQSVEARLADLRLATAVRLALVQDAETRALDVDVAAENGAVRLTGDGLAAAARIARGVSGVRSVNGQGDAPAEATRAEPARAAAPVSAPRVEVPAPRAEAPVSAPAAAPRGAWGAAPRAEAPAAETHVVGRGETLFSLARRYDTTVEALRRLNGLSSTAGIEVGQRLRVR